MSCAKTTGRLNVVGLVATRDAAEEICEDVVREATEDAVFDEEDEDALRDGCAAHPASVNDKSKAIKR
ncbi:MAG: hypothetical protein ABF449_03810 [Ethanoligenens sp.]